MAQNAIQNTSLKTVPSPKGHFLVGSLPEIRRDLLQTFSDGFAEFGDIVRFKVGPSELYVIGSPDYAQEMLVTKKAVFQKPYREDKPFGLALILGRGLLTNPDTDSWLTQRRMMQPMFHRNSINTMTDKMIAGGEDMLARWDESYQDGATFNLSHEMMKVTLDIINRTMFSANVMADADDIGSMVETALHFIAKRVRNPFALPLSTPLPTYRAFNNATHQIDSLIYNLINQRRNSGENHDDLLDMLLNARDEDTGEGMTDVQLRDEVMTIFGAGHETTANGLTWAWYRLSQHPDVLEKLQNEVDTVLEGRTPTREDLQNLPYTLAVFEEVMRLHPPAPITIRMNDVDATLGGYHIPAGTRVIVSFYHIHRHVDYWNDPETFNPDRFLPENKTEIDRHAYLPFGGGQRMCIGNHFALMEAQLLLVMMVQKVELKLLPDHDPKHEVAITLRPKYGMQMTVHRR